MLNAEEIHFAAYPLTLFSPLESVTLVRTLEMNLRGSLAVGAHSYAPLRRSLHGFITFSMKLA